VAPDTILHNAKIATNAHGRYFPVCDRECFDKWENADNDIVHPERTQSGVRE
jgi:hypothetical protein